MKHSALIITVLVLLVLTVSSALAGSNVMRMVDEVAVAQHTTNSVDCIKKIINQLNIMELNSIGQPSWTTKQWLVSILRCSKAQNG